MKIDPNFENPSWTKVYQLLQSGDYEQAAELLQTTEADIHHTDRHPVTAMMAGASRQICLALIAYRAEIDWHQLARGNAELRERTLSQHVLSMLALVGDQEPPTDSVNLKDTMPTFYSASASRSEEPLGLWQRIQDFFSRKQHIPSSRHGQPLFPYTQKPSAPVVKDKPTEQPSETSPLTSDPSTQPSNKSIPEQSASGEQIPLHPKPIELPLTEVQAAPPIAPHVDQAEANQNEQLPSTLTIYCLGPFRVVQNGEELEEWNGQKGVSILKYLIAHHGSAVSKDVLMDVFWPGAAPEASRRNLHQAIYSLRQTLRRRDPETQHIRFENNQYVLNSELGIWIDAEEFETSVRNGQRLEAAGQLTEAMAAYSIADSLYQGNFLEQDVFEDWIYTQREHLRNLYLEMAGRLGEYYLLQDEYTATIALCQKILTLDNCDEEAHLRLMRSYLAQGQRHLAIRQYQTCVQSLQSELDVPPSEEITALYEQILSLQ